MRRAVVAFLLVACGGEPSWSTAFDETGLGALSGVWGASPDDVFVVGGAPGDGQLMHFDGTSWAPETVPESDLLVWVHGFGDEVWAVGQSGSALRRRAGTGEAMVVGTAEDLWGVGGAAPDDVWIVGGAIGEGAPLVYHWDGTSFEQTPIAPEQNDRNARSIFKVYGVDGRVFAVGQGGLIVEWDGTAWMQMSAGAEADEDFVALWSDADGQVTAVGGRSSAQVATLEGNAWTTFTPPGMPGLNAVSVDHEGTFVVGGASGFVGRLHDGELVREEAPELTSHDVHAMWSDGEGTTWAVGGRFYDPYEGTAWERRR
jgi:hypothetical protein